MRSKWAPPLVPLRPALSALKRAKLRLFGWVSVKTAQFFRGQHRRALPASSENKTCGGEQTAELLLTAPRTWIANQTKPLPPGQNAPEKPAIFQTSRGRAIMRVGCKGKDDYRAGDGAGGMQAGKSLLSEAALRVPGTSNTVI